MNESEIKKYEMLNELADPNGIVVFGGSKDLTIPLGEIRQAFDVKSKMYNRSISELSVKDALSVYEDCVAPLAPETILLHIGEADLDFFKDQPSEFDNQYRALITHIKSQNRKCRIAVVSLQNDDGNPLIKDMNRHFKHIADSERCEYGDITSKKVWNPKSMRDAVSFVYSIGFVRPLKNRHPMYDLVKMLFCCEA
jgi:hypothetical protein